MALISNYGELKAALSTYLFHQRFVANYDLLTALFETDANARLRVLPMEHKIFLTTVGGTVPLPADYITWRTVKQASRPYLDELEYVHPAYLTSPIYNRVPPVFTIEGNNFITTPVNDAANEWEFHYYREIPTIAGGANTATNWLITEWPNAYLFGLMTEAAALGRNGDMAQLYKARRDEVFQEIIQRYALTTGATSPTARHAEYF